MLSVRPINVFTPHAHVWVIYDYRFVQDFKTDLRFQSAAVGALREASEKEPMDQGSEAPRLGPIKIVESICGGYFCIYQVS